MADMFRRHTKLFVLAGSVALILIAVGLHAFRLMDLSPANATSRDEPSLQLLSPGPTSIATYNQASGAKASTAKIDDEAMKVAADRIQFVGLAKGLRSVALVIGGVWTIAVPDASGAFNITRDLSDESSGPLVVDVYGWDVPPDQHNFTTALSLRVHLLVVEGKDRSPPAERGKGHPAQGRKLVWQENFDQLSPKIWHAGPKPDGQEYSAAAFMGYDSTEAKPYTVMNGFLRLRSTHVPGWKDPKGFGREWLTGHLSTGFPDGTASGAFRKGYFEARMLLPSGPGCWPSFWLLDQHGIRNSVADGAVEVDVIEGYGHGLNSYVATEHNWPPPSAGTKGYERSQKNITGLSDYSLAFHDYGVEVTDDELIFYFDGQAKFRTALYRKETVSPFFMMLTLAMSQDWPITVPPSGYYDLWIDHVRVYQ